MNGIGIYCALITLVSNYNFATNVKDEVNLQIQSRVCLCWISLLIMFLVGALYVLVGQTGIWRR
jgi:uncharacterized membrane protein